MRDLAAVNNFVRTVCDLATQRTPRFVGQPVFVPYYWALFERGHYSSEGEPGSRQVKVVLTDSDFELFPELHDVAPESMKQAMKLVNAQFPPGARATAIYLEEREGKVVYTGAAIDNRITLGVF